MATVPKEYPIRGTKFAEMCAHAHLRCSTSDLTNLGHSLAKPSTYKVLPETVALR